MSPDKEKKKLAVLASENGTNLQAILDACQSGKIGAQVVVVVSNKKYATALTRAREAGVEALVYDPKEFSTRTLWCSKMAKALKERNVDLVCLAGFMLRLEPCMVRAFPKKIINIHPALLPKYGGKGMYGQFVHRAVLEAGEEESGCTIHLVDEIYDHGAIVAQATVKVEKSDTPDSLAEKIHPVEHQLYVSVLKDICSGKLSLNQFKSQEPGKGN